MSKNFIDGSTLFGVFGCAVGILGIGYAIGTNSKLSKISERLDLAIDDIADNTEIDIPEGITRIGQRAFAGNNFREIVIPSTVREIGDYAFSTKNYLRKSIFQYLHIR